MKRAVVLLLAVACATGTAAAVGVVRGGAALEDLAVSQMMPESVFPRCTDDDERLTTAFTTLGVLDAHPEGATPYGNRDGGCDDDDRLSYAGRSYRLSAPRADLPSFYQEAGARDGWRPVPVPPPERKGDDVAWLCLTKVINDRKAYLSVSRLDGAEGKADDGYYVRVVSGPSGSNLC
ncbi:hypothetical protein [Streptosporangium sp. NPDC051022]|uniref:hypothetical protein n=1 Tax=Streptosporangium sp. NPDC051022 TaxID=3155752 RepID=UPI0034389736